MLSCVTAQVEFYFSDSNLPRDKFLREKIEADPQVGTQCDESSTLGSVLR